MGLATARKLHSEGANVTIADLNEKAGKSLEAEFGERCLFQKVDVTKEDQVAAAVENTVKTFGTLNGCINSAGLGAAETATVSNIIEIVVSGSAQGDLAECKLDAFSGAF